MEDKLGKSQLAFDDSKKNHEAAMLELSNINENLSLELIKAKQCAKTLQVIVCNVYVCVTNVLSEICIARYFV